MSLEPFIISAKVELHRDQNPLRLVSYSDVSESDGNNALADYMADRAPLFYREPSKIVEMIHKGWFLTAIKEVLQKLPTSQHFHDSHFGEILSAIFAETILGWKLIYSKLSLLTTQNANANKMDLIFYIPDKDPVTFVMGEVKSSMKSQAPAHHHKSCYADLFKSLKGYSEDDLTFDLTAARDHIEALPAFDQERVKNALLPYRTHNIMYAGFIVVDTVTRNNDETRMLATRGSSKEFDVDLICVEKLSLVSKATFAKLEVLRKNV